MSKQQTADQHTCPRCSSTDTVRESADVGVGVIYGPLHCNSCGFNEEDELLNFIGDSDADQF